MGGAAGRDETREGKERWEGRGVVAWDGERRKAMRALMIPFSAFDWHTNFPFTSFVCVMPHG